jgi:hypothetical protein
LDEDSKCSFYWDSKAHETYIAHKQVMVKKIILFMSKGLLMMVIVMVVKSDHGTGHQ